MTSRRKSLVDAAERHVPRGLGIAHPISIVRGQGAVVWDTDGREYLDFVGGIGVLNVGHEHPRVIQAAKAQMERFTHMCFQVAMYEGYVRLAERLNELAPIAGAAKTALFTTGAEAVENAVKIARAFTGRPAVVAFSAGFHGRTLLGMSLTGKTKPYKQSFGPFAPEVYHARFPYAYRGVDTAAALDAIDELFATQVAPDRVAAFVFEPVAGEGGFIPMPPEFLRALRDLADQHGILLIDDEIQTGFGRTGRYFAIEHSGVAPDLIASAKSLAGGFPLSAVTGRAEVMDAPAPGGLGGTYGGNPVAVAAALAVIDVLETEGLLQRSEAIGARLKGAFLEARRGLPQIGDVRGLGGMVAIELIDDPATRHPASALTDEVLRRAREAGVLLLKAGMHGNVVRFLVPLVVDDAQLDRGIAVVLEALRSAVADAASVPA